MGQGLELATNQRAIHSQHFSPIPTKDVQLPLSHPNRIKTEETPPRKPAQNDESLHNTEQVPG